MEGYDNVTSNSKLHLKPPVFVSSVSLDNEEKRRDRVTECFVSKRQRNLSI